MKSYDGYKTTPEAIWYEKIPIHWESTKLRTLFAERNEKVSDTEFAPLSVGKMGVVPQLDTAVKSDSGDNRKLIKKGDFAINSRSDRKGAGGISEYEGSCSLIINVLKPCQTMNRKYYHYLLRNYYFGEEYYRNGKGLVSDLWTTKFQEMKKIFVPVPPIEEQDQIVRYLDWKTAEMNRFIRAKKKQIKKLEELKCAKIDQFVSKGLNTGVEYKNSDVEWLDMIPKHWSVEHIKQHFAIKKRIAGKEGFNVLSITQKGLKIKNIESNEGQMAQNYSNYQFVYPGDFAMNHMDLITGYVDLSDKFGVTSPDYRVFILTDTKNCYAPYYLRVFQIGYKRRIFYKFGKGAASQGRWRLPKSAFYDYPIRVPPIEEQIAIEEACKELEEKMDVMIADIQKEISLVEEFRTKLISDVVTGQIDVRGIDIPDYIKDENILDEEMVEESGDDLSEADTDCEE